MKKIICLFLSFNLAFANLENLMLALGICKAHPQPQKANGVLV